MSTLLLGLGNPILTDDGVGIHVVRAVAMRLAGGLLSLEGKAVTCAEASVGGLRLLDVLAGHKRVILVDAIQTTGGNPGQLYRLSVDDLTQSRHSGSTHDLSLAGALLLGRNLGMDLPLEQDIAILAIEVEDVCTFDEVCTPAVAAAIPQLVEVVLAELAVARLQDCDHDASLV